MEPVRFGQVPAGLGTADLFVTVETDDAPLLRVDLYANCDECFAFEEVRLWANFVAIGWGHHLYMVKLPTLDVSAFDLGSYFGHMDPAENYLLISSAKQLFCIGLDSSLRWQSGLLGIDGVIVDRVEGGVVHGQGEWDPPGGWRRFAVSLLTGEIV